MPVKLNSTGGGSVTLTTPSTASDFTATFPAATGNVVTTGSTAVVSQAMLASGVAGNGPAFGVYLSANQTITGSTYTKVQFNTEEFDTNGNYDNSTNYRFTPTIAGYYQINTSVNMESTSFTPSCVLTVFKNGSEFKRGGQINFGSSGNAAFFQSAISALIYLNGSTDYVEVYGFITAGGTVRFNSGQSLSWFSGSLVRSA